MQLEINTWQRVMLRMIVGTLRGDLQLLRKGNRLLDVIEMTEEELKQVGMTSDQAGNMVWKNPDHKWKIEIANQEDADLLRQLVKDWKDWPIQNVKDVLDLAKQLGVED